LDIENQSRKARARSVWVARQAGKKHTANEAIVITTTADPNASGSRGLTLYKRFPSSRVNPSAAAAPRAIPPAVNAKGFDVSRTLWYLESFATPTTGRPFMLKSADCFQMGLMRK
jgi:hypothetical protein